MGCSSAAVASGRSSTNNENPDQIISLYNLSVGGDGIVMMPTIRLASKMACSEPALGIYRFGFIPVISGENRFGQSCRQEVSSTIIKDRRLLRCDFGIAMPMTKHSLNEMLRPVHRDLPRWNFIVR